MNLVLIHGAPAVGKLTVAKALLEIVPGRLFDNHAAIDLARTVFDFGAPGFMQLVNDARLLVLEAAAAQSVPLVVVTFVYAEPEDRALFEAFEEIVHRHGGRVMPVFLRCAAEETARRVGNADRVARRKLTSPDALATFCAGYTITQVPRPDCLVLETDSTPPNTTARTIADHFQLAPARPVS